MIDRSEFMKFLSYDPQTGLFHWLVDRTAGTKAGDVAGCKHSDGGIVITLFSKQYKAGRLAWFFMFGEWALIDHKDTVRDNNRADNLRKATQQQNSQNRRRTGKFLKGVKCNALGRTFSASITQNGKNKHLGNFKTETAAHDAYATAAKRLFGEFARLS